MDCRRIEDFVGGWIIGDFEPSVLRTKQFEVGWKQHFRAESIAPHIHQHVTEYNFCVAGRMMVNGKEISRGDVFILHKGERVDASVLTDVADIIVVKVPSVPADKVICEQ